MTAKAVGDFPFQGRPRMLYMDGGPIAKSLVFNKVMGYLGIEVRTHMPRDSDGNRPTARAKGKVERPFRTVKEMHETLYHLHEPETEAEANAWLKRFLLHYNGMADRTEAHSRQEDWLANLPPEGIRAMCNWERFSTFAREPVRRKLCRKIKRCFNQLGSYIPRIQIAHFPDFFAVQFEDQTLRS